MNFEFLNKYYDIDKKTFTFVENKSKDMDKIFKTLEAIKEYNQIKVIHSFMENKLSQSDFSYTTGYGYGDSGRDKTEAIFARIFETEDALVRPIISSGTHAISVVLTGILKNGDKMLSISDHPYDSLLEVIGIKGSAPGSLKTLGIEYDYVPLMKNFFDKKEIKKKLESKDFKLVYIQRSTGYGLKRALTIKEISDIIKYIRNIKPNQLIMVDNCYGEFTEELEPTQVGADICAGSLIKNPGGGIALSGGYIVSNKKIIEMVSNRLYAPGIGKETGMSFDMTRSTLQGLFFGPHVTIEALKSAILIGKIYSSLGFEIYPKVEDKRSDIIQAIVFNNKEMLIAFVQGIQKAATVGAHVTPYPWEMPGYQDKVIMASGGFVDGSSIEISADGPLRDPYVAYYQGGIVFEQAKLACMISLQNLKNLALIDY